MFYYWDWTFIIVLPAILFALWAQLRVKTTFAQYSKVPSRSGMTAAEAARRLLQANGVTDVRIERVSGTLTDHYDPRSKTLRLSDTVYNSNGVAAIGVACHEAGHAIQHATHYAPLHIRMAIVPICNIGSKLSTPLFLIGLLFASGSVIGDYFMLAGIGCFSLATLFQLVTLPVEFNASTRALDGMREGFFLSDAEVAGAKKVLTAAALTYVAALATSLLSLLRLLAIRSNSRR